MAAARILRRLATINGIAASTAISHRSVFAPPAQIGRIPDSSLRHFRAIHAATTKIATISTTFSAIWSTHLRSSFRTCACGSCRVVATRWYHWPYSSMCSVFR